MCVYVCVCVCECSPLSTVRVDLSRYNLKNRNVMNASFNKIHTSCCSEPDDVSNNEAQRSFLQVRNRSPCKALNTLRIMMFTLHRYVTTHHISHHESIAIFL